MEKYDEKGISRTSRQIAPADLLFKIESVSLLLESKLVNHESNDFEVGDYKWRLCFYPKGNKEENGEGYISLYLVVAQDDKLPFGWEIIVNFKLFVYDQIRDSYLTIQDGEVRRFNWLKKKWGFSQLLPLAIFNDPKNGYLVDDACVFGAELLVIRSRPRCECMVMVKYPMDSAYTWRIEGYKSKAKKGDRLTSNEFIVGGRKWNLLLDLNGNSKERGKFMSLFLELADEDFMDNGKKQYAKYKLRVLDQLSGQNHEYEGESYFGSSNPSWGFLHMLSLKDLKDASKNFIVDDILIVEAEITVLSSSKDL